MGMHSAFDPWVETVCIVAAMMAGGAGDHSETERDWSEN